MIIISLKIKLQKRFKVIKLTKIKKYGNKKENSQNI